MEDIKVAPNNSFIIIIIFIVMLVILGLIIWIIVMMIPKHNVQLYGTCVSQIDCASGLVCSSSSKGYICLNGLDIPCTIDSECADSFVCHENKCTKKISTILNSVMSNLTFENQPFQMAQPFNAAPLQAVTRLETISPYLNIQNVQNGLSYAQSYAQNAIQLSPLMGNEKKKLTHYL